jgi:hypothetical protein
LRLVLASFFEACERGGFGVSVGVGFGGCGLVSVIGGVGCGVGGCVIENVGSW